MDFSLTLEQHELLEFVKLMADQDIKLFALQDRGIHKEKMHIQRLVISSQLWSGE